MISTTNEDPAYREEAQKLAEVVPHHLQTPPFQPLTHPHNYPYYKNISAPWQAHPYKKCNTHPNIQKTLPA